MKKIYLSLIIALAIHQFVNAQWTVNSNNTYYNLTGNVGIGNQTPTYKLDVGGMLSSSLNGQSGLHIYNGGGVSEWLLQQKSQSNSNFTISSLVSGTQYDYFVINTNGYVGIGTTNPQATLDINGAIHANTEAHFSNGPYTDPLSGTAFGIKVGGNGIAVSGNSVFLNGNILIGKTSQTNTGYILDVAGSVRANSVVINSTGADFVFEPTYKLRPLIDLKTYIDQNHHLPEIESAKQMQAEGLNVGDNQTKLLQKIEELTLYVIQLKEQNELLKGDQQAAATEQTKKAADQEARLKALETKLNQLLSTSH